MIVEALLSVFACMPYLPTEGQAEGGFDCQLALSADLAFQDRWAYTINLPEVRVPGADMVSRGQVFGVYVFFSGCTPDEQGAIRVQYDYRILRPDGTIYHDGLKLDGHSGQAPPGLLLAQEIPFVSFDPQDPLGGYSISVSVRDLQGGHSVRAEATVELVEYDEGEGFNDQAELWAWLGGYSHAPDPTRLIPALRGCALEGWAPERGVFHGALRDLFESNHWLVERLLAGFPREEPATRRLLLWILSRSSYDATDLIPELETDDLSAWQEFSQAHDPLTAPIRDRLDLNELWGMYIARRTFAPLLRLCMTLSEDGGAFADVKERGGSTSE